MKTCIYPGSFDPPTLGHIDIINRASKLFDRVIVGVLHNPRKQCVFEPEERIALIKKALNGNHSVEVAACGGLLVDFARENGCVAIVKGVRSVADFEYEKDMALCNGKLNGEIQTVLLNTDPNYSFISSSAVRELLYFKGDLSGFVPEEIKEEIQNLYNDKMGE